MATENKQFKTTVEAGEDLNTAAHQYQAVALDDGKLATSGEEASGILHNKPKSGEFMTVCYIGESKFKAGAAITKGAKLTVSNSGYFTTADSNDPIVGEAKLTVTSGSIGTGLFNFPTVTDKAGAFIQSFTPKEDIIDGAGICFKDFLTANNGEEIDAIALAAMTSGTAAQVGVMGLLGGVVGSPSSAGDVLTVAESGYFIPGDSGDYICARVGVSNIASGTVGNIIFGIGQYLSV